MTVLDSLHSLLDYKCLLFYCDSFGSDLRIGHFFSFRCPLVSTPRLNTQLLSSLTMESLNSLTNQSIHEFTRELSFITRGEPTRDHHLEQFACYSFILCLSVATKRA
jgi:hypothetical protein